MRAIAERMGRSPEAVKKLLSRALRELRRSFSATESLHLPEKGLELERQKTWERRPEIAREGGAGG